MPLLLPLRALSPQPRLLRSVNATSASGRMAASPSLHAGAAGNPGCTWGQWGKDHTMTVVNAFDLATATAATPPEVLRGVIATVADADPDECRGIVWLDAAFRAVVFHSQGPASWADVCWVHGVLAAPWASLNVRDNPCRVPPAGADCE